MALLSIFKPKWQHSDAQVRLEAVKQIDEGDQKLLSEIVAKEEDLSVLLAALKKISDIAILEDLARQIHPYQGDILKRLNQAYTANILVNNPTDVKLSYLGNINDEKLLSQIAVDAPEPEIRLQAVEKISDQSLLSKVIQSHCGREPGLVALQKISDISLLEDAALKAKSKSVRAAAQIKVTQIKGPSPQQLLEIKAKAVKKLLQEAKALSVLADPEAAYSKFILTQEKWLALDLKEKDQNTLKFHDLAHTIQKRLENFIQHKESEQQRNDQFQNQFVALLDIIDNICELFEQNEAHSPERLFEQISNWDIVINRCDEAHRLPSELLLDHKCLKKASLKRAKKIVQERDLLAQIEIDLNTVADFLQKESYSEIPALLSRIHSHFVSDKFEYLAINDALEKRDKVQADYDAYRQKMEGELSQRLQENLENRHSLLKETLSLLNVEDVPLAGDRIKEIQRQWAEKVELPSEFHDIDKKFQDAIIQFKEVQENFYKAKDWQLWTNRNIKEELIGEMKSLENIDDLHLVFKQMKDIQERWNLTGDVPAKIAGKLWSRFSKFSDLNFKRCQIFFEKLDAVAEDNRVKKQDLISQAISQQDSEEWTKTADFLKDLQLQWRESGRLKKDEEEELYVSFREACNVFFEKRKEHYHELSNQRLENLKKKETFCQTVEDLLQEPSLDCAARIQEIQKEWKTIGPGPKDQDEAIWVRFRGACNRYYEWLDTTRPENLTKKEALCQKAEALTTNLDAVGINLEKISRELISCQKEWKNIGPAPKQDENKVWKRFRKVCDVFFEKRKAYYDELDKQRPINEMKKSEFIQQVKQLTQGNDKKSVTAIIRLQEEWKDIGPATKKKEDLLNKQFQEECDTFFKARRHNFEELDRIRRENLKKKEELCVRLELLAGISQEKNPRTDSNNTLTLAEQLKLAFESNFILAGDETSSKRRKKDEINQVQKEWDSGLGEVPKEHEHAIQKRYKRALAACQEDDKRPERKNS